MKKLKKDSGHATSVILETLTGVLVLSILLSLVFTYGNQLLLNTRVNGITRSCIQQMEIEGCLTPEIEAYLVNELEQIGLTNIDCSNSTLVSQENGKLVILDISAQFSHTTFVVNSTIKKETKESTYSIHRTTISKRYY